MKCEFCDNQIEEGNKFCNICGAEVTRLKPEKSQEVEITTQSNVNETLQQEVEAEAESKPDEPEVTQQTQQTKQSGKMKFIGVGIIVVIVLMFTISLGGKMIKGDNYIYTKNIDIIKNKDTVDIIDFDESVIYSHDEEIYNIKYSFDRSQLFFVDSKGGLYYCNGKSVEFIDDDVYDFKISDNGVAVAYVKHLNNDSIGELYVNITKSGKSELVSREAYLGDLEMGSIVLSGDGSVVGFLSDFDDDKYSYRGYIAKVGKEAKELGKSRVAIAISDKGKLVYFARVDSDDRDMDLYVKKGNDEVKLLSGVRDVELTFNADLTQVLFFDEDDLMLSVAGKEGIELESESLRIATSNEGVAYKDSHISDYYNMNISIAQKGVKDLTKMLYTNWNALYYLNNDMEMERILSRFDRFKASDDNTSILYTYKDDLLLINDVTKPDKIKELGEHEDITELITSKDLSQIYYINDDDELMYVIGDKAKLVADDPYNCKYFEAKGVLLMLIDDELYYSKKGSKAEKIQTDDDVIQVMVMGDYAFYIIEDNDEIILYRSKDGIKYEEFYSLMSN